MMTPEQKAKKALWWKNNRAKASEYRKQWRLKNPEAAKELGRRMRKRHADRIRIANRDYYARNKDKVRAWNRKWKEDNYEKHLEISKQAHRNHPEIAINAKAKRRHRIGNQRLSKGLTKRLLIEQNGLCKLCTQPFGSATPHRDHIIPISKGGPNLDANIQLLCRKCNQTKSDKMPTSVAISLTEPIKPE